MSYYLRFVKYIILYHCFLAPEFSNQRHAVAPQAWAKIAPPFWKRINNTWLDLHKLWAKEQHFLPDSEIRAFDRQCWYVFWLIIVDLLNLDQTVCSASQRSNKIQQGIFNIEGGCYAKAIGLTREQLSRHWCQLTHILIESLNWTTSTKQWTFYFDTCQSCTLCVRICTTKSGCSFWPAAGHSSKEGARNLGCHSLRLLAREWFLTAMAVGPY